MENLNKTNLTPLGYVTLILFAVWLYTTVFLACTVYDLKADKVRLERQVKICTSLCGSRCKL